MLTGLLKKLRAALLLTLAFVTVLGVLPAQAATPVVRNNYVVTIKEGSNTAVLASIARLGESAHDELTNVLDGFILALTDTEVAALRLDTNVVRVEQDQPMSLMDTQSPTPSWGLDRIDQQNTTYDNSYSYPSTGGAGVRVYVVDTGVMASNPDFTGRVETGFDAYGANLQGADCQGHGTHVAGTIGGTNYGVAKKVTIVPVRVLGCSGSGTWSAFIAGLDWIAKNNPAGTPAVMSASIGGGFMQSVNDAVQNLYAAGITPVIAAGNSTDDACKYSPSSAPNAITVGATDNTDARAYFSNYGDCVDVFAPGLNIVSDNYQDPTTPRTLSGTSMATPHVSGLAALYLAANPTATPAQVTVAIQAGAQSGVVTNALTANNYLINNTFLRASLPPVGSPTGVAASNITTTGATISWSAPTGTAAAQSYNVEYKVASDPNWIKVSSLVTSYNLTALTPNTPYSVRVSSVDGSTVSLPSPEVLFTTAATAPNPPTNVRSTQVFGNVVYLTWDVPQANGTKINTYNVWQMNGSTKVKSWVIYSTTGIISGLTPSTAYTFQVEAVSTAGVSALSAPFTVTTIAATPNAVGSMRATNITSSSATISWAAVAQIDPNTPITYSIRYGVSGSTGTVVTTNATSFDLTGLPRYSTIVYNITALSGTIAGPVSFNAAFITLASVPTAVTNLGYSRPNTTQAIIAWQPPRDSGGLVLGGFQVDKFVAGAWVAVATLPVTTQQVTVTLPARGTTDVYRVAAFSAIGMGPYLQLNVTLPTSAPSAVQNLAGTLSSDTRNLTLTWQAPADDGGSAIVGYRVFYGTSATSMNTMLGGQTALLTATIPMPVRGVASYFTVVAVNSIGTGVKATPVSFTWVAGAPAAPLKPSFVWQADGTLKLLWALPADNGGSAITGYTVQRLEGADWVTKYQGATASAVFPREAPGSIWQYRLIASNALGDSPASPVTVVQVPFVAASAPQNFTATDNGSAVAISFAAPANLGGGAVSYYSVLASKDGGVTWVNVANTTSLTPLVVRPTKGQNWQYKVAAVTQAGAGAYTNAIAISIATTVPGATSTTALFNANGSIDIRWYPSADNGGLALTGFLVEKSYDQTTWTTVLQAPATQTYLNVPRENPGVRIYVRVSAINANGAGVANVTNIMVPYVKAATPQNFAAVDNGSVVVTSWAASTYLGGSAGITYYVQTSRDGGANWTTIAGTTALTVNVTRPAKATSQLFRVVGYTSYGYTDPSATVTVSVAATVAGAPLLTAYVMNADKSITATWRPSTDNGGSAVTAYRYFTSTDGVNYSAGTDVVANSTAATFTVTLPAAAPGVRTYFKVAAVNAIGVSANSGIASLMTPYVAAAAVTGLNATVSGVTVNVNWTASANLGGTSSATYYVYTSLDGVTYTLARAVAAGPVSFNAPAKGMNWFVRVVTMTAFGVGGAADLPVAIPATVTGQAVITGTYRMNAATLMINFVRPNDLGGLATWNYKLQQLQGANWVTIATGVGANTNSVTFANNLSAVYQSFRVIANNSVGDAVASNVVIIK